MNEVRRETRPVGQEHVLLDYVQRLDRFHSGRRAVHVHFSRLRAYNRRDHHLRVAATTFDRLIRKFDGAVFRMSNNDMVVLTKGATVGDIDEAIVQLRFLFSEDPVVNLPDEDEGRFVTWYDLEKDYGALLGAAERMDQSRHETAAPQLAAVVRDAVKTDEAAPLDPINLARIEKAIAHADLTNVMRRQPICRAAPHQAPLPMFQELYISIADLTKAVLPGFNITANRWLFQHLTQTLDARMLALLLRRSDPSLAKDFSLNLNVGTVLSPDFLKFDREVNAVAQGTVVIELQQIDIFADPGSFFFARDFLTERGYKVALDGVKHLALPLIDRERLGVDFVKFEWGYGMVDELGSMRAVAMAEAVKRIGHEHLVLCRCDSPEALRIGQGMGIQMYQGRFFDGLLYDAKKRETALSGQRAVG